MTSIEIMKNIKVIGFSIAVAAIILPQLYLSSKLFIKLI